MELLLPVVLFYYSLIGSGNYDKTVLIDYVAVEAQMYGVDPQLAIRIVKEESHFNKDSVGDTDLICRATGKPMRSRGLWQWNTCGHTDITDEMAFDPIISTNLALTEIKKNGCKIWSVCEKVKSELALLSP